MNSLRFKLYNLFVTNPVKFALLDTAVNVAIGLVIGLVAGYFIFG